MGVEVRVDVRDELMVEVRVGVRVEERGAVRIVLRCAVSGVVEERVEVRVVMVGDVVRVGVRDEMAIVVSAEVMVGMRGAAWAEVSGVRVGVRVVRDGVENGVRCGIGLRDVVRVAVKIG